MPQRIRMTTPNIDRGRRSSLTAIRLGIAMVALGLGAALALVLVPSGTGPADTHAIADLSSADLPVDGTSGPALTLANDHADSDRYVSANPFTALRTNGGNSTNAAFGFGRLTSDNRNPRTLSGGCTAIVIAVPEWGVMIDTGYEVCEFTGTDGNGNFFTVRFTRIG